jgi:hypothetical protein
MLLVGPELQPILLQINICFHSDFRVKFFLISLKSKIIIEKTYFKWYLGVITWKSIISWIRKYRNTLFIPALPHCLILIGLLLTEKLTISLQSQVLTVFFRYSFEQTELKCAISQNKA